MDYRKREEKLIKIGFGSDHGGVKLKSELIRFASESGFQTEDYGTYTTDSVDYPDFAEKVCVSLINKEIDFGLLICRTGIGMSMAANKYKGVRAALCYNLEVTKLTRQHNDANVICLPADFIQIDMAKEMLKSFVESKFEAGRHQKRVKKIHKPEV